MANYRLTREADADMVEIARYTRETWGEAQRDKYINELFQLFEEIASNPMKGRRMKFRREGIRRQLHPARLHGAYYRMAADGVPEILRVLHAKQDQRRAFG
ncbi:MAG: type II toxin-antitoxin system RelE/ParE family toxin [Opitutales bacterium]